jgi:glutamate/tyrosine decarboxylase-like PLP-dependent enzyme
MAIMSKVCVDLSLAEVQRETFLVCGGRETISRICAAGSHPSHYSVGKAAQQLGIEARAIATARTGEVDVDHLASVLDEIERDKPNRPILMSVTIGTTQTGALDDLPSVHSLLVDKVQRRGGHFSIHVDAALMGPSFQSLNHSGMRTFYESTMSRLLPSQDTNSLAPFAFVG